MCPSHLRVPVVLILCSVFQLDPSNHIILPSAWTSHWKGPLLILWSLLINWMGADRGEVGSRCHLPWEVKEKHQCLSPLTRRPDLVWFMPNLRHSQECPVVWIRGYFPFLRYNSFPEGHMGGLYLMVPVCPCGHGLRAENLARGLKDQVCSSCLELPSRHNKANVHS